MLNRLNKSAVLWAAVVFGFFIAVLSVIPINRVEVGTRPQYAASASMVHHAAIWHILVHVLLFSLVAAVAWFATTFAANSPANKLLAVVLTLLLGCTTEWLQHTVYKQAIELNDVYTNVAASAATFLLLWLASLIRQRRLPAKTDDNNFILRDLD